MNSDPIIIAIGCVDSRGIANGAGFSKTWAELDSKAPGSSRALRALTDKEDQTFRRLNRPTRALVLAAEACGVDGLLSQEQRDGTGLVVETETGCIECDLRYARLLKTGLAHAAIFPYTLPSTCLGDITLRHGLRGPSLSLSIHPGEQGEALREAKRLIQAGDSEYVLVGSVEGLDVSLPGVEPMLRAVVCLVAAPHLSDEGAAPVAPWPVDWSDPFLTLGDSCQAPR
jgi:3-oxoacyl-(acyl-carrier-protein) synthase